MDILILDSWLRDFLQTKADPKTIAEKLSLCGPSVEKLTTLKNTIIRHPEQNEVKSKGSPTKKYDTLYHVEITANRPDLMGHIGFAREAATILNRFGIKSTFTPPTNTSKNYKATSDSLNLNIPAFDIQLCSRVTGIILDNIEIKASPPQIQQRLKAVDIRALNNAIDITNYIMITTGQPMHAFDYDKILDQKLIIRQAKSGEEFISLDNKKYKLTGKEVIFEDGQGRIIDLPGIIGGGLSSIDENTKRILLFVEHIDHKKIRYASMKHEIRTVAAQFNEKNPDPTQHLYVLNQAIDLFTQHASAKIASEIIDIPDNFELTTPTIKTQHSWLESFIGIKLNSTKIVETLNSLEIQTSFDKSTQTYTSQIPTFRASDMYHRQCIAEEVARIIGYFDLPSRIPPISQQYITQYHFNNMSKTLETEQHIKHLLQNLGYTEIYTYSTYSPQTAEQFNLTKPHVELLNPIGLDQTYMRQSLTPNLINYLNDNKYKTTPKLFELSNTYYPNEQQTLPDEISTLLIAHPDYFTLKGSLEYLAKQASVDLTIQPIKNHKYLNPQTSGQIIFNNIPVGFIGHIKTEITDIQLATIEINLATATPLMNMNIQYKTIKNTPSIIEDLTFTFPPQTYIQPIINQIQKTDPLITKVTHTDTYQNSQTFNIHYQSQKKNLTDADVAPIRAQIVKTIQQKFNAKLKGQLINNQDTSLNQK